MDQIDQVGCDKCLNGNIFIISDRNLITGYHRKDIVVRCSFCYPNDYNLHNWFAKRNDELTKLEANSLYRFYDWHCKNRMRNINRIDFDIADFWDYGQKLSYPKFEKPNPKDKRAFDEVMNECVEYRIDEFVPF